MGVLRAPPSSPLIYQRALLSGERAELFASARRPARAAVASAAVRAAFAEATGSSPKKQRRDSDANHRGSEEDDCPICCEALGTEKLEVCKACSNAIHADCLRKWARAQIGAMTCPLCRAAWPESKADAGRRRLGGEGYLNFGAEARLPSERDES